MPACHECTWPACCHLTSGTPLQDRQTVRQRLRAASVAPGSCDPTSSTGKPFSGQTHTASHITPWCLDIKPPMPACHCCTPGQTTAVISKHGTHCHSRPCRLCGNAPRRLCGPRKLLDPTSSTGKSVFRTNTHIAHHCVSGAWTLKPVTNAPQQPLQTRHLTMDAASKTVPDCAATTRAASVAPGSC